MDQARQNTNSHNDFLSDCRLMLRFARRNGLDLSPKLGASIGQLDVLLTRQNLMPVSDLPPSLVSAKDTRPEGVSPGTDKKTELLVVTHAEDPVQPNPAVGQEEVVDTSVALSLSNTELILQVHEDLSRVVAPATALSLQTSEPPPGRHRFLGGMPLVVKAAAVVAIVNAVVFVISAGFIGENAARKTAASAVLTSNSGKSAAGHAEAPTAEGAENERLDSQSQKSKSTKPPTNDIGVEKGKK